MVWMISQAEQMILIGFARVAISQHLVVGKKFQIDSHFAFQQPGERIEPAEYAEPFGHHRVDGVPLRHMGVLVGEYFVQLNGRVTVGIDEYPAEEGERSLATVQAMHPHAAHTAHPCLAGQGHNAHQLPRHSQRKQAHTEPIYIAKGVEYRHRRPLGVDLQGRQHVHGIALRQGGRGRRVLYPPSDVEHRQRQRHAIDGPQREAAQREKRVAAHHQPVETVEQHERQIDFEQVNSHKLVNFRFLFQR